MLKAQTRLQTHILTLFLSHQWWLSVDLHVFSEMQMNVFIYRIIYAELKVLLYWKHTVCSHIQYVSQLAVWQLFCLAGFRATESDSTTKYTADSQAQSPSHTNPLSTRLLWIQLCSLPSTASRKGSLMFRYAEATEVICLHPGVHESSVELALRCVSRPLLWYQEIITPSGPLRVVHAAADPPPFTYMFCWHKKTSLKELL